jgi:hypothetical protein
MQTIQYITMDKSKWGPGPWQEEPDKLQWQDPATGLACLIVRGHHGGLCGYVGVAEGHRFYGKGYNDDALEGIGICHAPDPGEPDNVWWFGFDCVHAGDHAPALEAALGRARDLIPCSWNKSGFEEYRDLAYVRAEVTALALQLAPLALPAPESKDGQAPQPQQP